MIHTNFNNKRQMCVELLGDLGLWEPILVLGHSCTFMRPGHFHMQSRLLNADPGVGGVHFSYLNLIRT